ncbi:MAG: DEAD/DEAH box helicase [Nitrospirota bacterium]
MNIFNLRENVINDYQQYIEGFLNIQDERIRGFVSNELSKGILWPDPLVQLNPSYEMGRSVSELVSEGLIDPLCEKIFQKDNRPFHLYFHQERAIRTAAKKEHYILTTGTGSGKSLTYLIPIIDHVLKNYPEPEQVRAIIVYPMNALINSQEKEIEGLLSNLGEGVSPIRFGRYTGQENRDKRDRLQQHPPHILLTNYVMLELMMSRPAERVFLDRTLTNLEFLVLDELHTYTGRQGADVSMLVRRLRQRCGNDNLICIGTSATMVSGGSHDIQRDTVAKAAGKIFGITLLPENVIDERLIRSIQYDGEITPQRLIDSISSEVPVNYNDFIKSPLNAWIEETFGIQREDDYYKRRMPITLHEGAERLHDITGLDINRCTERIRQSLHKGSGLRHPDNSPVFAVKLHQFISKGDSVYATFEPADNRSITLSGQRYAEGESGRECLLAPLVFCRICGQEYYQVTKNEGDRVIEPRLPDDTADMDEETVTDGYLLIDREDDPIWSEDRRPELPENWLRQTKNGLKLKNEYREFEPQRIYIASDGTYSDRPSGDKVLAWFLNAPFLICLSCNTAYDKRTKEYTKLARLSTEGRSSATTTLCLSILRQMKGYKSLDPSAHKVMSFTDNRQDASLQAGHFNDFVQVGYLRGAIYRALPETGGLDHSTIASEVFNAMNLPASAYAQNPGDIGIQPKKNREAFIKYIEYRIFHDLRRGWRVIQPNLEQSGLLRIEYPGLDEVCRDDTLWRDNPVLASAGYEDRFKVTKAFLDHLRRSLAINARCLQGSYSDTLKRDVNNTLKEPWRFDDDEILLESKWFAFGNRRQSDLSLASASVIGKYLRSPRAWHHLSSMIDASEYERLLKTLIDILYRGGYLERETDGKDFRVQIRVDSLQWVKGEGIFQAYDPVRSLRFSESMDKTIQKSSNPFFIKFYREDALQLINIEGREHTGQTSQADREKREERFKHGNLSCLFCSPTMELGIDIADLNIINMRNVPPTPANYAQRSGRAGRSGQPAFIITYCSTGSGHDQYFFRRRPAMVSGVVRPPQLDLANEDMVKSHVRAIWLAGVGLDLKNSIRDIIDLTQDDLPLSENVRHHINLSENRMRQCIDDCRAVLKQCKGDIDNTDWYSEEWLETTVRASAREFDDAFNRWREIYRIARNQLVEAQALLRDAHLRRLSQKERHEAEQSERESRRQIDLLCNDGVNRDDSDFYPYRYLASEGFLPGYNFPRLPVRAFIQKRGNKGDFISRPRFLAVSEFGPRNIVYQEGRKYRVVKSWLPISASESRFVQTKICNICGTFHTGDDFRADTCGHCNALLNANNSEFLLNLFEMTTVSTWRIDRITCDEDERIQKGYEISTHFRFSSKDGKVSKISAEVLDDKGDPILRLSYSPAANLWRINRKWRRSNTIGYTLDLRHGIWNKRTGDINDTALDSGEDNIRSGVQIFVKDTRNILLVETDKKTSLSEEHLANLQYALQKGLCALFQIDEGEIGSERLGQGDQRSILYWEAAEGGVGVLQHLVNEPDILSQIARLALELCHFDSETGNEIESETDCARACYECLLSYRNQRDHAILNRHIIKDILTLISHGKVQKSYENRTYDEQYEWLRRQTDSRSNLERELLDHIYREGRRLPDFAQKTLSNYYSRPDFYYEDGYVCVFCDGTPHDQPQQLKEDKRVRNDLRNLGYMVVVIRYDRPIAEQIEENKDIFGVVRK